MTAARPSAGLPMPAAATPGAPHVRDATDLRRLLRRMTVALVPAAVAGVYNAGRQANVALAAADGAATWRAEVLAGLGLPAAPASVAANAMHGLLLFVPVCLVAFAAGATWERVFAVSRGRRLPGLAMTVLPFALALPPTVALWQVAVGISFGVVVAKEMFGGTGRYFVNPALAGLAFLYFAYPDAMRREAAWVAVDGWTGAPPIMLAATGGMAAVEEAGISWLDTLLGDVPGAFGDTSALACLLGAALLVHMRAASWRVVAGGVVGLVAAALVIAWLGVAEVPFENVPWYWHLTLGRFAFGLAFLATDPVTAAVTNPGRWIYGLLVGAFTVLVRVANPIHAEGALLAILLGNVSAPLIDRGVIASNVRRRARRTGAHGA